MRYSEIFEAPRTTLPLGKHALPNARDRYGALIAVMAPIDFLRLTTYDQAEIKDIISHPFTTVDNYDTGADAGPHGEVFNKSQYNMPYLNVLYPSGTVTGHEGRHRAAMVLQAGGTSFPVVIYFLNEYHHILHYTRTNYGVEPEESTEHTEHFTDRESLRAREQELHALNRDLDQPFSHNYFRTDTLGGNTLRGNPERQDQQDRWAYAKWQPSDMPAQLVGQFDHSIRIPISRMRIGHLKRR